MHFPTVEEVAAALESFRDDTPKPPYVKNQDTYLDVRLQVNDNGEWDVYCGEWEGEDDEGGYWGHETINHKSDMMTVAESLLDEARDEFYVTGG